MSTLRVVDSGLRGARENLALTEALRAGLATGTTPDTLRFQHFPPSAIIGRHQRLEQEIDLGFCRARNVDTARRMTGGGAIVMGPGILGWELIFSRARVPAALGDVTHLACEAVASGLRALGAAAAFRPRNDVEIGGRKVCGTGGYFDGDVLVFQGTVLVSLDLDLLTGALRLPARKLAKRGLEAMAQRVTDLAACLGRAPETRALEECLARALADALGATHAWGELTDGELAAARVAHDTEIGTEAFVTGANDVAPEAGRVANARRETAGGTIEATIRGRDGGEGVVDQILISGDFFVTPPRAIADLEARLRGARLNVLETLARDFLTRGGATFLGATPEDVAATIGEAARAAMKG